jgi:photosystem II stability/assembly factor-like uncharacterized protein
MLYTLLLITSLLTALSIGSCATRSGAERWSANDYPNIRVQIVDAKNGFIVGPRLIRTNDSGTTWTIVEYPRVEDAVRAEGHLEFYAHDVEFVDRDWGWRLSLADKNSVEWTEDSGQTWSQPLSFGPNVYQRSLVFVSRDKVGC